MHYVYILLCVLQFVAAVGLIVVVLMQESKNDGLTGQIGTTAASSFKGKAGKEEYLGMMTRNLALAFFVISLLVAIGIKYWA
jgi:protein translocase SecG subunit